MDEKISVIVPVYNVEKYLERCVNSIINQTYKNLEIILVDDGSTDSSGELCDELAKSDERIKVIHKENGGVSAARNDGIKAATGQYINFVDSDDIVASFMLEKLHQNLKKVKADISVGSLTHSYNDEVPEFNKKNNLEVLDSEMALKEFLIAKKTSFFPVAKLFRKELLKDIEFSEEFKLAEDALFMTEVMLRKTLITVYSNIEVYAYCHREGSATTSINKNVFDTIKVYDIIIPKIKEKYPNLERYLNLRRNWANLEVYDKLILVDKKDYKEQEKKIKEAILSSIGEIIKEPLFNYKRKLALITLIFSKNIYKKLVVSNKKL